MAAVNIGQDNQGDAFYRYKMPSLQARVSRLHARVAVGTGDTLAHSFTHRRFRSDGVLLLAATRPDRQLVLLRLRAGVTGSRPTLSIT